MQIHGVPSAWSDDPTANVNQNWTVTYEGALSSVSGITGAFSSDDGYQTAATAMRPRAAGARIARPTTRALFVFIGPSEASDWRVKTTCSKVGEPARPLFGCGVFTIT
jgi:hypothetical protein